MLRLPEAADELPVEELLIDPEDIEELVVVDAAAHGAVRRRGSGSAPARALLLPRRRPDQRTPLWQQRQKAADLLAVAGRVPDVPDPAGGVARVPATTCSTCRRCGRCWASCEPRRCASSRVDTPRAVAVGPVACCSAGSPPTCTRATPRWPSAGPPRWPSTATCCATCWAPSELRELLDPGVLADVELELQRLVDGRRARSADELHDVLRRVGDLTAAEVDLRVRARRSTGRPTPARWSSSSRAER